MRYLAAIVLAPALLAASPGKEQELPIGRVLWGQYRATGFMVDRCTLVTTRHIAAPHRVRIGKAFRFDLFGLQRGAKVVAFGQGRDMRVPGSLRASDWLVARLDRCLDGDRRYFHLLAGPVADSELLFGRFGLYSAAGFPGGRRKPAKSTPCRLRAVGVEGTIETDCRIVAGYSGGPLFVRLGDGKLLAIGIISAGDRKIPAMLAAPVAQLAAPGITFAESPGAALTPINSRNPTSPAAARAASISTAGR